MYLINFNLELGLDLSKMIDSTIGRAIYFYLRDCAIPTIVD